MADPSTPPDPAAAAPTPSTRRSTALWAWRTTAVAAFGLALVLELSGLVTGAPKWWLANLTGIAFVADAFLVWLALVALVAITNRVMLSVGLLGAFVLVVALANRIKLNVRSEPIYPSDVDFLGEPGFLTSMVSPVTLVLAGVAVLAVVVGAATWARRHERRLVPVLDRGVPARVRTLALGARLVVAATALALLTSTAGFNDPGNPWRKLYGLAPQGWRTWNQKTNYEVHGFLGGFLYNMPTVAMRTPAGYSPATMAALADKYEAVAETTNAGRRGSLEDTNVVFVLSESFSDPTELAGLELDEDPIPRTRALMRTTTSGPMLAQLYGGGTANMEFESLTGQSVGLFAPQLQSPYQQLVTDYDEYPSAVGWFTSQGHEAIAVHPFHTGMYKRKGVYRTFGFEDFVHDTTMAERDRIDDSEFISDASAFAEVERQIARADKPLLVNLVTMQNHIPMTDAYDDPIDVRGVGGGEKDRIGNWARGLAHTDAALADFLDRLRTSEEKTVVVFYGDHLPGIFSGDVKKQNPGLGMYRTPFFLWSSEGNAHRPLPMTSPVFFLPLLYELADAPVPPYFALLDRLRTQVSALEQERYLTPDGTRHERIADLPAPARQVLEEARLVQYDASVGRRYVLDRMWPGSLGAVR